MTTLYWIIVAVLLLATFGLYFLPWLVALFRGHINTSAIFVTNLLLGWSGLGWIVALIWAFTNTGKEK